MGCTLPGASCSVNRLASAVSPRLASHTLALRMLISSEVRRRKAFPPIAEGELQGHALGLFLDGLAVEPVDLVQELVGQQGREGRAAGSGSLVRDLDCVEALVRQKAAPEVLRRRSVCQEALPLADYAAPDRLGPSSQASSHGGLSAAAGRSRRLRRSRARPRTGCRWAPSGCRCRSRSSCRKAGFRSR